MKSFNGLYVRCVGRDTAAVIFGRSTHKKEKTEFVQIITKDKSYYCEQCGRPEFNERGITLNIDTAELKVTGAVAFGEFTPIRYDAMGPFKFLPFMECRHTVISMRHKISGEITINGRVFDFNNGVGYIEGDRGKSFPVKYFWSTCNTFGVDLSIFASAAVIPYLGMRFNGTICIIQYRGKEYRLATYLGAKICCFSARLLTVRQGRKTLEISVPDTAEKSAVPLRAPSGGQMGRTIYENAETAVRYKFTIGGQTIFDLTGFRAAYEFSSQNG